MMFGNVGTSLWRLELFKPNLLVQTLVFTTDLQVVPHPHGIRESFLLRLSAVFALSPGQVEHILSSVHSCWCCALCPQTLSHSLRMADQNFEKLKDESDRLEQHAKKSVNWLLWIMLIVVCFIFIGMILFIRIFPKLKWFFLTARSQKTQLVCYVSVIILATCGVLEEAVHGLPSHLFCAVDEFHDRFHGEHFGYFVMFFPS